MNFQGFSPESFEQFIRALSLKVIGPGVSVFGNGPDGGREATFEGKVNFPFPTDNIWNGYGVLQAKFKEKLENTQAEQKWAKAQLEDELEKWLSNDNRSPKPDYFIFCTNVELSSAINGGKDVITKVFKDYKDKIGLKAFAIWDANQLSGYIDIFPEIRQRFTCFFTPGDLLAEMAKKLVNAPNPDAVLTAYLCKEILADEDARLSQAGDRSEDRIRLAQVFVDLPVADTQNFEFEAQPLANPTRLDSLQQLLRASAFKLDPLALEEYLQTNTQQLKTDCVYGRFVFLGGPGSGKSTIGQFLAQIHRAALLERRESHRVENKVRSVIKEIKARCEQEQVLWPNTPRYPFRVELNAFAKALAKNEATTLSSYLRRNLSQDLSLSHEALREWLTLFPWLLILDGLDEVPTSSNRKEVIIAIQNFLNEARDVEADLMIVASSRPDGYAGEFDGDEVAHKYLQPLPKDCALECAQRYVDAKTAAKGNQRVIEAMASLTQAVENPLIAKLMCSPLQVTFMVTVVTASGRPSDSRWQLFSDYYRIIYERELHKAVPPFDVVLNERRSDISTLHHRVGFILQSRAESSGGTQAELTIDEFESLVAQCLQEIGLEASELESQKQMIIGAANQRLVFLTSRTPGKLSFDVRSLQEYMAAACLTNNDDIIQRLDAIAHSAFWRNTLLFAIGRFFVDEHLRSQRDKIRLFCEDLNHGDDERAQAKLGSHLALDILESGVIGNIPLIIRSLTTCALKLLAQPVVGESTNLIGRLANIYTSSVDKEFRDEIEIWLGQLSMHRALTAWLLILRLEKRAVHWTPTLITQYWPQFPKDAALLLTNWIDQNVPINDLDIERVEHVIPQLSFKECYENLFSRFSNKLNHSSWFHAISLWWGGLGIEVKLLVNSKESGIEFGLVCIPNAEIQDTFEAIKLLNSEISVSPDWQLVIGIVDFYMEPSTTNLAKALEHIAVVSEPEKWSLMAIKLSWPIAIHLMNTISKTDLLERANQIRAGIFGDSTEWLQLQDKWVNNGIDLEEAVQPLFNSGVSLVSIRNSTLVRGYEDKKAIHILELLAAKLTIPDYNEAKDGLLKLITFYGSCKGILHQLDFYVFKTIILSSENNWHDRDFISKFESVNADALVGFIDFYNNLGQIPKLKFTNQNWKTEELPLEVILNCFAQDPTQLGLLRLAGFWCAAGREADINPSSLLPLEKFFDPRYRLSAMLVRMSQPNISNIEAMQMLDQLAFVTGEDSEAQVFELLVAALENHAKGISTLNLVLSKLIEIIPEPKWQLRARAENLRLKLLQAKPSAFDDAKLKQLSLPTIG